MYTSILVPLDGSERAEAILPHVESLAGVKMGTVFLLHVIEPAALAPPPPGGSGMPTGRLPEAYEDLVERMKELGAEYLSGVQSALKTQGIEAEITVEIGPVVERIIHTAQQRDVDLIAIASHGHTGLSRVFFGSVAAGVLHRAERPLLVVRSREPT